MDEQIREYFDRLFAETADARRLLEERFEWNNDRIRAVLDSHSKGLHDLHVEYLPLRAGLVRVEEAINRTALAVVRIERDIQEKRPPDE